MHGVWGAVCDDQWDEREAEVVCRQLGYDGRELSVAQCYLLISDLLPHITASYALISYYSPEEIPHHLDDVNCYGNESLLSECIHPGIGYENCLEGSEYAGVICSSEFIFCMLYIKVGADYTLVIYYSYIQWNLGIVNTVKVKYLLGVNHYQIQHIKLPYNYC